MGPSVKPISFVTLLLYWKPTSYISRIKNQDRKSERLHYNFLFPRALCDSVLCLISLTNLFLFPPTSSSSDLRKIKNEVTQTHSHHIIHLHTSHAMFNASTSTTHSSYSRRSSKRTKSKTLELKLSATSSSAKQGPLYIKDNPYNVPDSRSSPHTSHFKNLIPSMMSLKHQSRSSGEYPLSYHDFLIKNFEGSSVLVVAVKEGQGRM